MNNTPIDQMDARDLSDRVNNLRDRIVATAAMLTPETPDDDNTLHPELFGALMVQLCEQADDMQRCFERLRALTEQRQNAA
jgi:hypothetical protein